MRPPLGPRGDNFADRNRRESGKARGMGSAWEGKDEDEEEVGSGDCPSQKAAQDLSVVHRIVGLTVI